MIDEVHPSLDVDDAGQLVLGVAGTQLELGSDRRRSATWARSSSSPVPYDAGDPYSLERIPCEWCGGDSIAGTTCPRSIECPACHAGPGSPCKRPSSHEADTLHAERVRAAEAIDAAAGISYGLELPAPIGGQLELGKEQG